MDTMVTSPLVSGDEMTKGQTYAIRLTDGRWVRGRFLYESTAGRYTYGRKGRQVTHYIFQNIDTGRTIEIKSRVRIRSIVEDKATK